MASASNNERPALPILPPPFLRSLEGDLRALCADSKRRGGSSVKESAERVILLLKEADDPASELNATDEAASAFCTACELPSPGEGSSAIAAQIKVVTRAVACIHKLLTHRAVSGSRLPQIVTALESVGLESQDDSVTVKVLQAVLGLLTVREYISALPVHQVARAFALLFKLRSARVPSAASVAAGSLAAISGVAGRSEAEDGVIELTAKAAFRQVAADLFACASDTFVAYVGAQTSDTAAGERPHVIDSACGLFKDLCVLLSGDDTFTWLPLEVPVAQQRVDEVLVLEVIHDALDSNMPLFTSPSGPLSEMLPTRLCPAVHERLASPIKRNSAKALFALVVVLIRCYWQALVADSEVLMVCIVKLASAKDRQSVTWQSAIALDALSSTIRETDIASPEHGESNRLLEMFKVFDLRQREVRVFENIFTSICSAGALLDATPQDFTQVRLDRARTGTKPQALHTSNPMASFVSSVAAVCVSYAAAVDLAAEQADKAVCDALLAQHVLERVAWVLGRMLRHVDATGGRTDDAIGAANSESTLGLIVKALDRLIVAADRTGNESARSVAVCCLTSACIAALSDAESSTGSALVWAEARLCVLYGSLFKVQLMCGERFGDLWGPYVEAMQRLDHALYGDTARVGDTESSGALTGAPSTFRRGDSRAFTLLKDQLEESFASTSRLSWDACGDLVSALVVSSRSSFAGVHKGSASDEANMSTSSSSVSAGPQSKLERRVFGIARAESVMTNVFSQASPQAQAIPSGLWQLLTGHLVAVSCDSMAADIRASAIRSLTRISICALEPRAAKLIAQAAVILPLSDLLASPHADTREASLDAVYSILEKRGESLDESEAWVSLLHVLQAAAGAYSRHVRSSPEIIPTVQGISDEGNPEESSVDNKITGAELAINETAERDEAGAPQESNRPSEATIQRAFRAVQLIADDFLSFLAYETLPTWIAVVHVYATQTEDVNVALTSVGLLWRTADYFAKNCERGGYDALWMQLFEVLKIMGCDGRPEVRNGAVKTLTGSLRAHGQLLTANAWKGCVERALLPLLEGVMHGGAGEHHDVNGSRGRENETLVLHHSRDTPRKQWNETRVLALGGVAGVLGLAMPRFVSLRDDQSRPLLLLLAEGGSGGLWAKLLGAAGLAASSPETEVSLAGVSALLELLNAAGSCRRASGRDGGFQSSMSDPVARSETGRAAMSSTAGSWVPSVLSASSSPVIETGKEFAVDDRVLKDGKLSALPDDTASGLEALWDRVWDVLLSCVAERGLSSEASREKVTNPKALVMLATGLGTTWRELSGAFTQSSCMALVDVLLRLAVLPAELDTTDINAPYALPARDLGEVRKTALIVAESLLFGDDEKVWEAYIRRLLAAIRSCEWTDSNALVHRLLELLVSLYANDHVPRRVKAAELDEVLAAIGRMMSPHYGSGVEVSGAGTPRASSPNGVIVRAAAGSGVALRHIDRPPLEAQGSPVDVRTNDTTAESESAREPVWSFATRAFQVVLANGLLAGRPKAATLSVVHRAAWSFLYSGKRDLYDSALHGQSLLDIEGVESHEMAVARCVRDALGHLPNDVSSSVRAGLMEVLSRGAQEGVRGRRPRYVQTCQSCLFSLADRRWHQNSVDETDAEVRAQVAVDATSCIVEVSKSVLGRYIADMKRAGKCPLPAVRRAEALFLLHRLKGLQLAGSAQDSKWHLRRLHGCLCECVDTNDSAVRALARTVLDDGPATESSR